ncbi:MAG TPA: hypothetical protein VFJ16_07990 [Longimicrobium sp.]|nr:hypothetical protein [Longimicrobium sp.]
MKPASQTVSREASGALVLWFSGALGQINATLPVEAKPRTNSGQCGDLIANPLAHFTSRNSPYAASSNFRRGSLGHAYLADHDWVTAAYRSYRSVTFS